MFYMIITIVVATIKSYHSRKGWGRESEEFTLNFYLLYSLSFSNHVHVLF